MHNRFSSFVMIFLLNNALFSAGWRLKPSLAIGSVLSMGMSSAKKLRLDRIVSDRGAGSRSEVTLLLQRGAIAVDNVVIKNGATMFPKNSKITIRGAPLISKEKVQSSFCCELCHILYFLIDF